MGGNKEYNSWFTVVSPPECDLCGKVMGQFKGFYKCADHHSFVWKISTWREYQSALLSKTALTPLLSVPSGEQRLPDRFLTIKSRGVGRSLEYAELIGSSLKERALDRLYNNPVIR